MPGDRIPGIDAARALAIAGMVTVHFGPVREPTGPLGHVYSLPHGRAAILFALLAGVGVSLLSAGPAARRTAARVQLGYRAALLMPLGLALTTLDHGVLVIIHYYAGYFLLAAAATSLSRRTLLAAAIALAAVSPVVYLSVWHSYPGWFDTSPTALDSPVVVVRELVVSGSYPILTWAAPLLFGMWLGRLDLRDAAVRSRMVIGGAGVAVGAALIASGLRGWVGVPSAEPSWLQLVGDDPHSQMPLWLVGSAASATAALGLALYLAERLPRVSWPLVATGQLALSVYVVHLFLLHWWVEVLRYPDAPDAAVSVARFMLLAVCAAVAWRAAFARGPLEGALRLPPRWSKIPSRR